MKLLLLSALACLALSLPALAAPDVGVQTSAPLPLTDRDKKQMADEIKQGQDAADQIAKQSPRRKRHGRRSRKLRLT